MVYCGKPSRGCLTCKTRRIKCDEARPFCTRCEKSSRICPGYPDEFDLVFRNVTTAVKRRAQRARARSAAKKQAAKTQPKPSLTRLKCDTLTALNDSPQREESPAKQLGDSPVFGVFSIDSPTFIDISSESKHSIVQLPPGKCQAKSPMKHMDHHPGPSFWGISSMKEELAISFFFRNYVHRSRVTDSRRGFLEHLTPMYNRSSCNSSLYGATYAVAMGALSNARHSTPMRLEARRAYGKAIKELSLSIKDPTIATSNETLMTVLLFSLYEQIMCSLIHKNQWASHVHGAVALVKLRAQGIFQDFVSQSLFQCVRSLMVMAALQQGIPSEQFPDPMGWQCDEGSDLNNANRLTVAAIELPTLKHDADDLIKREKTPAVLSQIMSVIKKSELLDQRLKIWYGSLPDVWKGEIKKMVTEEPKDSLTAFFWPGPVYVYQDLNIPNVVNEYRVHRLTCQSIILNCVESIPPISRSESLQRAHTESVFLIRQLVDEVSSTVPYMLGFDIRNRPDVRSPADEKATVAMGAYFAAGPLSITRTFLCISPTQRQWLLGRLYHIGREFAISEVLNISKSQ